MEIRQKIIISIGFYKAFYKICMSGTKSTFTRHGVNTVFAKMGNSALFQHVHAGIFV